MSVTLVLIKPDAVRRRLVGCILKRLEATGLDLVRLELARPHRPLLEEHYRAHRSWDGFSRMIDFMDSGLMVAGVLHGPQAVLRAREAIGPFKEGKRVVGTIRGDFMRPGDPSWENLAHGSDSVDEAAREARLWFGADAERGERAS